MFSEEGVDLFVVEFTAIVTLDSENREVKLSASIGMKGSEGKENIRFLTKGKGSKIMSIIIHNNQVITKTRGARNR
jgi:predicted Ser/Thr protein kinase